VEIVRGKRERRRRDWRGEEDGEEAKEWGRRDREVQERYWG
jgi:hypothetical protein